MSVNFWTVDKDIASANLTFGKAGINIASDKLIQINAWNMGRDVFLTKSIFIINAREIRELVIQFYPESPEKHGPIDCNGAEKTDSANAVIPSEFRNLTKQWIRSHHVDKVHRYILLRSLQSFLKKIFEYPYKSLFLLFWRDFISNHH
eukprot:XP_001705325.1 Hypothetical protein GL50803_86403 [Giardia lamblia ATCC 50803]